MAVVLTLDRQKVKQSHYVPEHTRGIPRGRVSQISRQSAHGGGKVVSTGRLYPQEVLPVLIYVKVNSGAIVRPEGLCQ